MANKVFAVVEEELLPDLDAAVGVDSNPSKLEGPFECFNNRVATKKLPGKLYEKCVNRKISRIFFFIS